MRTETIEETILAITNDEGAYKLLCEVCKTEDIDVITEELATVIKGRV